MIFSINRQNILPKKLFNSFKKIYGLGPFKIKQIPFFIGVKKNISIKHLHISQTDKIKLLFENYSSPFYLIDEYRKALLATKKLISIKCYRGNRLRKFLPVHGQRTHTNAKSARKNKIVSQILSTLKE